MSKTPNPTSPPQTAIRLKPPSRIGDGCFRWLAWTMAMVVLGLTALVGWELFQGSVLSLHRFGWRFLVRSDWDPVNGSFGALPFIFGTLVSSLLGLILALPLGVATA
ncbi:MAG: phosphate ABC transporter permease subunit PstC, partial [Verrucomicrobia bacterium]|nr:phosphate ABC transporter permease subunit PstC [Verrucomicrobiota bacterium]